MVINLWSISVSVGFIESIILVVFWGVLGLMLGCVGCCVGWVYSVVGRMEVQLCRGGR